MTGRNDDRFWSLRGLSWRDLTKRACRRSWDDEVFGQAARLAFYYFLSMFPVLLLLLIWLDTFAAAGPTGSNLRDTLNGRLPAGLASRSIGANGENRWSTECRSRYRRGSRGRGVGFGLGRLERDLGHDDRPE